MIYVNSLEVIETTNQAMIKRNHSFYPQLEGYPPLLNQKICSLKPMTHWTRVMIPKEDSGMNHRDPHGLIWICLTSTDQLGELYGFSWENGGSHFLCSITGIIHIAGRNISASWYAIVISGRCFLLVVGLKTNTSYHSWFSQLQTSI